MKELTSVYMEFSSVGFTYHYIIGLLQPPTNPWSFLGGDGECSKHKYMWLKHSANP